MTLGRLEIERRKEVERLFYKRVERSLTSSTYVRPERAAEYVTNAFCVHDTELLALAAVTFARRHVEALLAASTPSTEGDAK